MPILKPAELHTCKACGAERRVTHEVYGCDWCSKAIDLGKDKRHDVTVFYEVDRATEHLYFCRVGCVVRWLRAFKPGKGFNFMSLPFFAGKDATAFTKLLKEPK